MPRRELKHPHQVEDWLAELSQQLIAPSVEDLFVPKRLRNEPRDREQEAWARRVGMLH